MKEDIKIIKSLLIHAESTLLDEEALALERLINLLLDSIPKSKAREKIKELNNYRANLLKENLAKKQKELPSQNVLAITTFRDIEAYGKIKVLQDLLKENK